MSRLFYAFQDLSGFRIEGDVHYEFPPGTMLQSGGFLVVARDPAAVQSYYGISGVLGPWRAQTNVVLLAVDRAEVDRLCTDDPAFAERLARSS